jgi:hypothetical protein
MRRTLALVAALAVFALGCGDDDNAGDDQLSKQEFVEQANRICRENQQNIERKGEQIQKDLQQESDGKSREELTADALDSLAPELKPFVDRLKRLEPPDDLEPDWDKFLKMLDEAAALYPRLADAIRDRDQGDLTRLTTRFAEIAGPTRRFAQDNELDACLPDSPG